MKLSKKGISPLIATVLIIGFTVALAAVIMTWGSSFTRSMQESTEQSTQTQLVCAQEVSLSINSACTTPTGIDLVIENKGSKAIKKINFRAFTDATTVATEEYATELAPFAIAKVSLTTLATGGLTTTDINKIEGLPSIEIDQKPISCPGALGTLGDTSGSSFNACAAP